MMTMMASAYVSEADPTSPRPAVLLVDDRFEEIEPLLTSLEQEFTIITERFANRAVGAIEQAPEISVVLLDLRFDGQTMQGEQALEQIKARYPQLPVIILTSVSDVSLALRLVHREKKAHYYFTKDEVDSEQLGKVVENAAGLWRLSVDKLRMTDRGPILGRSRAIETALRLVVKAADSRGLVLITGEPGTGKELFARAIHLNGPRRREAFIAVNCGALPPELVATELFGSVRGAFSDARDRKGFFEQADKGTLFLDEILELPIASQATLLRAVESGEVQRLGGPVQQVDVRLIAATNRPPDVAIREGRLREDLYYRLMGLRIALPPLRERPEDIPELVHHMLAQDHPGRTVTDEALLLLTAHPFPGNVRELRAVLTQAALHSDADRMGVETFRPLLQPTIPAAGDQADAWVSRIMAGQVSWLDLRREFKGAGDTLREIVSRTIRRWKQDRGERPTGQELADLLGTNRNHVNQVLDQLGLRLRDFD